MKLKVLFALLAVALLFAADSGSVKAQSQPGPIVLMGIDAEDGGVGGHGPISTYVDVVNSVLADVANGGGGILVIGGGKSPTDDVTEFWNEIGRTATIPAPSPADRVKYVNGSASITAQPFVGFAMIAVASSINETGSGGLSQDENDALSARADDIKGFVLGGGGLLGLSQVNLPNPYGYLRELGTFEPNFPSGYSDVTPTGDGEARGIIEPELDVCCWHDTYT